MHGGGPDGRREALTAVHAPGEPQAVFGQVILIVADDTGVGDAIGVVDDDRIALVGQVGGQTGQMHIGPGGTAVGRVVMPDLFAVFVLGAFAPVFRRHDDHARVG